MQKRTALSGRMHNTLNAHNEREADAATTKNTTWRWLYESRILIYCISNSFQRSKRETSKNKTKIGPETALTCPLTLIHTGRKYISDICCGTRQYRSPLIGFNRILFFNAFCVTSCFSTVKINAINKVHFTRTDKLLQSTYAFNDARRRTTWKKRVIKETFNTGH